MRLTGATEEVPLTEVWAHLSLDEIGDLSEALRYFLDGEDDEREGWRYHVGGGGGAVLTLAFAPG